ncbi:MAG: PilZ domain-containing protein [Pseudomonadota bacterium]
MKSAPVKGLRQYARIPFAAQVLLHLKGQSLTVHLLDIALRGALVQTGTLQQPLTLYEKCRLELALADDGEGVVMSGSIVHLDHQHVGIACENIELTSLTRLRRLIELNTGDTELMDRELSHLFGVA